MKLKTRPGVGLTGQQEELLFISIGKREILLVYLPAFINIRMQVYFRGFYRSVPEVFLHNPEIF